MSPANEGPATMPSYYSTTDVEMETFDSLPPEIRHVLAEAPYNSAAIPWPRLVAERGIEECVKLAEHNIKLHIEAAARDDYGPDHPQARRR